MNYSQIEAPTKHLEYPATSRKPSPHEFGQDLQLIRQAHQSLHEAEKMVQLLPDNDDKPVMAPLRNPGEAEYHGE